MKKYSKTEAKKYINEFFENLIDKSGKDIRKIKRLAMSHKIPLKEKRKKFCGKCFNSYKNPKIRIKNKLKVVECGNCGAVNRWKI